MAQNYENYYAVIMAGGGGTRLWPLSRKERPKQMLSLFDERTLFQTSVERLNGVFPLDHIYVVTLEKQAQELQSQVPQLPCENFLIEPSAKGTAAVVGYAAIVLQKLDPNSVMAVLTADHFIRNENRFRQLLMSAYEVAQQNFIVTLGIEPDFPATAFGYIQFGDFLETVQDQPVYRVEKFKEKPDEEHALAMIQEGGHAWNSGMFVWRTDHILMEIKRQIPDMATVLEKIAMSYGTEQYFTTKNEQWSLIPETTIDYGIMEGASETVVIPAGGLGWNDVGSWDSLFDVIDGDTEGNIVMGGEHIGLDTSQTLIYVAQKHRLIVTIGINDLILVDTGDVLLVCDKKQAQKVRQVVSQLRLNGQEYL
jgi:mannose-1-phosphate guanylyltransferase